MYRYRINVSVVTDGRLVHHFRVDFDGTAERGHVVKVARELAATYPDGEVTLRVAPSSRWHAETF